MVAGTTLFATLGFELDSKGYDEAVKKLEDFKSKAETAGKVLAGALAGVAGAFLAVGASALLAADDIDKAGKAAAKFGTDAETLQKWEFAADRAGGSVTGFTAALNKLADTQVEALDASTGSAKAYKDLGIELNDVSGKAKDSVTLFEELHSVYNSGDTKKQAQVNKLLGGTFKQNLPLLQASAEELANLRKEGEKYAANNAQVEAAAKVKDSLENAQLAVKSLSYSFLQVMAPAIETASRIFVELIGIAKRLFGLDDKERVESFADDIEYAVLKIEESFYQLVIAGKKAWKSLGQFIEEHKELIMAIGVVISYFIATYIAGLIKAAAVAAIAFAPLLLVAAKIGLVIAAVWLLIKVFKYLYDNWDNIVNFFKNTINGLVELFKYFYSFLPQGIRDFVSFVFESFGVIKSAIGSALDWVWEKFQSIFTAISNFVFDVVNSIVTGITSGFQKAFTVITDIIGKIQKLPGINQIIKFAGGAADAFGAGFNGAPPAAPAPPGATSNTNSTIDNSVQVAKIEVNGAQDPQKVASAVANAIQPGGLASAKNAVSTNKRIG